MANESDYPAKYQLEDGSGSILLETGTDYLAKELQNYAELVRADGATGYWRLGDASGQARDTIGTNHMTFTGTPTYAQTGALVGETDTAIDFTSAFATGTSQTLPTGAVSLEAWCKLTSFPGDGALIGQYNGSGVLLLLSNNFGGSVYFYINANPINEVLTTIGVWHHVVGTWDGANARLYLNGTLLIGPTALAGPIATPAVAMEIGAYSSSAGSRIPGLVDEVAIYPTALTGDQAARHYRCGIQYFDSGIGMNEPSQYPQLLAQ